MGFETCWILWFLYLALEGAGIDWIWRLFSSSLLFCLEEIWKILLLIDIRGWLLCGQGFGFDWFHWPRLWWIVMDVGCFAVSVDPDLETFLIWTSLL